MGTESPAGSTTSGESAGASSTTMPPAASSTTSGPSASTTKAVVDKSDPTSCTANPSCAALGLEGICCPTDGSTKLACCNGEGDKIPDDVGDDEAEEEAAVKEEEPAGKEEERPTGVTSDDPRSCSAHSACISLGLTGLCCPTPGGVRLACCDSGAQEQ